jgi:ankyrin repeat protein
VENGRDALLLTRDNIYLDSKEFNGRTPLSSAAENGREAVAELLLAEDDIDLDSKEFKGLTLLSLAALNGHEATVKLLSR